MSEYTEPSDRPDPYGHNPQLDAEFMDLVKDLEFEHPEIPSATDLAKLALEPEIQADRFEEELFQYSGQLGQEYNLPKDVALEFAKQEVKIEARKLGPQILGDFADTEDTGLVDEAPTATNRDLAIREMTEARISHHGLADSQESSLAAYALSVEIAKRITDRDLPDLTRQEFDKLFEIAAWSYLDRSSDNQMSSEIAKSFCKTRIIDIVTKLRSDNPYDVINHYFN